MDACRNLMSEINKGFCLNFESFLMNGCCPCFNCHFDRHVTFFTLLRSTNYSCDKFVWESLGKKVLDQEDTLGSKRRLYKKLADINFERNTAGATAADSKSVHVIIDVNMTAFTLSHVSK